MNHQYIIMCNDYPYCVLPFGTSPDEAYQLAVDFQKNDSYNVANREKFGGDQVFYSAYSVPVKQINS